MTLSRESVAKASCFLVEWQDRVFFSHTQSPCAQSHEYDKLEIILQVLCVLPVRCIRSRAPLIALESSYYRLCLVGALLLHLGSIQQRNSNLWPSVPSVGADKFGLPVFLIHNPLYTQGYSSFLSDRSGLWCGSLLIPLRCLDLGIKGNLSLALPVRNQRLKDVVCRLVGEWVWSVWSWILSYGT